MAKYDINTLNAVAQRIHTLEKQSDDLFFTNRDCNSEVKQENYLRALQAVKNNIKTMMYE